MREVLWSHKWALVLALLASLICAFPQVYFRIDHAQDGVYQGIELLPDSPWSARIREVQDGHPSLGSIYFKDGKDDPYLFQPFGSILVGSFGSALGLSINDTILVSRLVLPFLVVLLAYGFVYLFLRDKLVALVSTAVLVFADSLMAGYGIGRLLDFTSPDHFLRMARPLNPAMIYIFLFGFLASFWRFYTTRSWRWGAVSAVLLGLNFYTYFYSWTYLYAFGGFLGLFFLIQKKWKEALQIGAVYVGALVVAIPYAINLYQAALHPNYAEASLRFGVVETHAPLFVGLVVVGILAAFFWWFPRENRERYLFALALMLAPLVTLNQQLLTGKVLQPDHYHWFFHKPFALIIAVFIGFYLLRRYGWDRYRTALAALLVGGAVGAGAFVQVDSYFRDTNDGGQVALERQKYGPAMQWLVENAEKEEVVLANNTGSHLVTIYTPQNVFYHRAGMYSLAASNERLAEQLVVLYRLRGVDTEDAREVFSAEEEHIITGIYGMHYNERCDVLDECDVPDEKIEQFLATYEGSLAVPADQWLEAVLREYEVAYVVWDREEDPAWQLDRFRFLEKAAEFGDVALYRVAQ